MAVLPRLATSCSIHQKGRSVPQVNVDSLYVASLLGESDANGERPFESGTAGRLSLHVI